MKKVYLNTPEEVIKALKDGKEIFLEEGGAVKVKLIDGFCVKEWNDQFNINYTINLRDKPFIYEQEPLEIEVGKFYKNKAEHKVRCFKVEKIYCHFTIDNYGTYITDKNGKSMQYPNDEFLDIIGPWED